MSKTKLPVLVEIKVRYKRRAWEFTQVRGQKKKKWTGFDFTAGSRINSGFK